MTDKIPPDWGPSLQQNYPFRIWRRDVTLWDLSTSVILEHCGPLLIAQLQGTAKTCVQDRSAQAVCTSDPRFLVGCSMVHVDR
eukprot:6966590-Prorocentrum_lima.AAC.1